MADWPSTLPEWQLPLSLQAKSGVIRTEMDTGPAKVRKRFTAVPVGFQTEMSITGSQRTTLDTFFHDTLGEGALSFDRPDPRTDLTESFRFLAPPQYRQIAGGDDPDDRQYRVSMNLEKLP